MTSQDSPASFGVLGAEPPVLSISSPPYSIIFEWAALLPLVIYLSSSRLPHRLVGQAALTDRASSGNDLRRKVWDVNWGSIFPCANGAVAAMLSAYALRKINVQKVPEEVEHIAGSKGGFKPLKPSSPFRRYRKLHILRFTETTKKISHARYLWSGLPTIFKVLLPLGLLGVSVICFLCGLYGTGFAMLLAVLLRVSRHLMVIEQPDGYLKNNEADLPGSLEAVQMLVMTYVAAQKGWDGVALLSLVIASSIFDSIAHSDDRLTSQWLKREGVKVEATTLQFSGRTPMIGTIQSLDNQRSTTWMDGIIAPSTRRDAWLQRISIGGNTTLLRRKSVFMMKIGSI
ncbi:hypothetical protein FGADI_11143 [Fusarium gaditjirri]|uniref:Uncharacterized protein n=1 Tax=Fusarium gaditjirri TaxID=282569 RepID=A0A8H4WQU0_9HYPO|nr:hypothetical protein FGADI_11143 [Fusarium gaditjirri]